MKTTEIYTHVAKDIGATGVRSPLDRLEVAGAVTGTGTRLSVVPARVSGA